MAIFGGHHAVTIRGVLESKVSPVITGFGKQVMSQAELVIRRVKRLVACITLLYTTQGSLS